MNLECLQNPIALLQVNMKPCKKKAMAALKTIEKERDAPLTRLIAGVESKGKTTTDPLEQLALQMELIASGLREMKPIALTNLSDVQKRALQTNRLLLNLDLASRKTKMDKVSDVNTLHTAFVKGFSSDVTTGIAPVITVASVENTERAARGNSEKPSYVKFDTAEDVAKRTAHKSRADSLNSFKKQLVEIQKQLNTLSNSTKPLTGKAWNSKHKS